MLGFVPLSSKPPGDVGTGVFAAIAATIAVTAGASAGHGAAASGAATVPVSASVNAAHGVAASVSAGVPVSAAADADFTQPGSAATLAAVVPAGAEIAADHGVAATLGAALAVSGAATVAHGGTAGLTATVPVTAAAAAAHGVAAGALSGVGVHASITALVERYELIGEVRLAGILVNRRVRAYRRDTGALVGEANTVAGHFRVHAGFVAGVEHLALPIDLSDDATDWAPPVANRVLPVLAQDA